MFCLVLGSFCLEHQADKIIRIYDNGFKKIIINRFCNIVVSIHMPYPGVVTSSSPTDEQPTIESFAILGSEFQKKPGYN